MDYYKVYQDNYKVFFKLFTQIFYTFYCDAIKDERQFDNASYLLVCQILENTDLKKNFSVIQGSQSRNFITKSDKYYKTDSLRKVINSELKLEFNEIQKNNNDLFIDYLDFLKSLSCQDAYWDYIDKTESEKDIIKVLFNLNKIDRYSFAKKPDYCKLIEGFNFEYGNIIPNKKTEKRVPLINTLLTKNENFLLWHILIFVIRDAEKGCLIELGRALVLSNINEDKLLSDEYKNNNAYKFLTSGIDGVSKKEDKAKLVKSLLDKIKPFKLKKTESKLRKLLNQL